VKTIFGILFFVIFAVPGLFVAGFTASELVDTQRFESPDQHAEFMRMVEYGVTLAFGVIGALFGIWLAGRLRPLFFRNSS